MSKTAETTSALVQGTRARIIQLLDEKGMSIVQLADAAGISEGGFHSRFREESIQLRILGAFAQALGVPVGHLLPDIERGEVVKTKPGERPYVEDRVEQLERKVRQLETQLKKKTT